MKETVTSKPSHSLMKDIRQTLAEAQSKHDRNVKLTFSDGAALQPVTFEGLQKQALLQSQYDAITDIRYMVAEIAGHVAQININLKAFRLGIEPFRLVDLSLFDSRLEERLWLAKSASRKLLVDPDANKKEGK